MEKGVVSVVLAKRAAAPVARAKAEGRMRSSVCTRGVHTAPPLIGEEVAPLGVFGKSEQHLQLRAFLDQAPGAIVGVGRPEQLAA